MRVMRLLVIATLPPAAEYQPFAPPLSASRSTFSPRNFIFQSLPPCSHHSFSAQSHDAKCNSRAGKTLHLPHLPLPCHGVYSSFIASFIISPSCLGKRGVGSMCSVRFADRRRSLQSLESSASSQNTWITGFLCILQLESSGWNNGSFRNIIQTGIIVLTIKLRSRHIETKFWANKSISQHFKVNPLKDR